jgi:hypothetical protein
MDEVQGLGSGPVETRVRRVSNVGVIVVVSTLLLAGSLFSGTSVAAPRTFQDGTDAGSVDCSLTAEADEDDIATATESTPVMAASPEAAASAATGQPADAKTTAEITLLVHTLAACLTDGQNETVALLVSQRYLGAVYGGGGELSRADFLQLASQLPTIPVSVVSVSDVRVDGSRNVNADVVTIVGNQLEHGRWSFVLRPAITLGSTSDDETAASPTAPSSSESDQPAERWLIHGVSALPVQVPADAANIKVTLDEYSFSLSPGRTTATTVVLNGTNNGDEDHEILVLRLERGVSSETLVRNPGPGFPDGVSFIGQQTIAPNEQGQLVLVDLAPGSYVLVCLLPDSDGTPHLALGMRARFRVEAE